MLKPNVLVRPDMRLRTIVAGGFVANIVIALTSATRGWPFPTLTAEPWFYQFNAVDPVVKYTLLAVFFAAVGALCWSWINLLAHVRNRELPVRWLFGIFVLWSLPVCMAAPLFSGDVYVYHLDGEALARGYNPYESGVSAMGPNSLVHMVHPLWRTTSTMYGTVFIRFTQLTAEISGGDVIAGVVMLRALAVASVLTMAASVVSLTRHLGRPVSAGFVFAVLNPLTLLHLVGGAHNDSTMLGLLMAGLAVGAKATRWPMRTVALFLCVMGAQFKIPALAGVLVLGWMWAGPTFKRRILGAIGGAIAGLAMFQVITMITGLGWGWLAATDVPGLAHPLLAPPNAVAISFGGLFGAATELNTITRALALLGSGLIAVWMVVREGPRAKHEAVIRAAGWGLLAVAWLGPAVYPWYLVWGIAIVGTLGAGRLEKPLIGACVVVSFLIAPGGYGVLDMIGGWGRIVMAFIVTAAFAWVVVKFIRPVVSFRQSRAQWGSWEQSLESSSSA